MSRWATPVVLATVVQGCDYNDDPSAIIDVINYGCEPGDRVVVVPLELWREVVDMLSCAPVIHGHPISRAWAAKNRDLLARIQAPTGSDGNE